MSQPLVSICLLCYNHEKYIEDCLSSFLSQDYERMELIICDNGSKDYSKQIIESYLPKLNRLFERVSFYKNRRNIGTTKACNLIVGKAKGEYIKLFSSDDIMLKGYIRNAVSFLEQERGYILCYSNVYLIEENDSFKGFNSNRHKKVYKKHICPKQELQLEKLMWNNYIVAPSVMIRKSAYEKYGMYDEEIGYEDYDFWLQMASDEKFGYLEECLIGYRKSETSVTNFSKSKKRLIYMLRESRKIMEKHLDKLDLKKQEKCKNNFWNNFLISAINNSYYIIALQIICKMKKEKIRIWKRNWKLLRYKLIRV